MKNASGVTVISRGAIGTLCALFLAATAVAADRQPDNAEVVQGISADIKVLIDVRPPSLQPTEAEKATQADIDARIEVLVNKRRDAYNAFVLTKRPEIEPIPGTGYFRLPVKDSRNTEYWFAGEIPALWQLKNLDDAVFDVAEDIRLHLANMVLPDGASITQDFSIGGTSAQSMVHPYPGDIDYDEHFIVDATSAEEASLIYADIIREFVGRNRTAKNFEFTRLRVMPLKALRSPDVDYTWSAERILDPAQRDELARQIRQLDGGRINTDWRARMSDGRFVIIGKIFSVLARDARTKKAFFEAERLRVNFQGAYFGREIPESHQHIPIAEFALVMKGRVLAQAKKGNYLKVAKRTFNFCRIIGNLQCVEEVVPVFATPAARVYHYYKTAEAIAEALDPATPTTLLTAAEATELLQRVAVVVEEAQPVPAGTIPERPAATAKLLRQMSAEIEATETGLLAPNPELGHRLAVLSKYEIDAMVQLSLKGIVTPIAENYVK